MAPIESTTELSRDERERQNESALQQPSVEPVRDEERPRAARDEERPRAAPEAELAQDEHARAEEKFRTEFERRLAEFLRSYQPRYPQSPEIIEAMLYGALSGASKRIRPLLTYGVAAALGGRADRAMPAAIAVEVLHCYSLIHDDLPAMDDDDLRRGLPSCHKKFGEATAILTGNLMQVVAFDAILGAEGYANKEQMLKCLIDASCDIVCGQAMDLRGELGPLSIEEVKIMHRLKCGVLIKSAMLLGAWSAPKAGQEFINKIAAAGESIGLAFQIRDDIMDIQEEGEANTGRYKSTYPGILGLAESYAEVEKLHQAALGSIQGLAAAGADTGFLRHLFRLMTAVPAGG